VLVWSVTLSRALAWVAQRIADRPYRRCKYSYPSKSAHALFVMKDQVVGLLLDIGPRSLQTDIIWSITRSAESVRSDRACPRNMSPDKMQGFHQTDKRTQ
jgi:hypothetical protein